ncbi:MAG TPA: hypothetical protein VG650_07045 [Mycobacteriales bacterium]|nr:hypothetical protein [Mycobacteriales bacterium]
MTTRVAATLLRSLAATRALASVALLARPDVVARSAASPSPRRPPRWVVRLLAGRVLLQATVQVAHPTRPVGYGGAAVDAAHAASLLPVLVGDSRYRRGAAISALEAIAAAGATYLLSRQLP